MQNPDVCEKNIEHSTRTTSPSIIRIEDPRSHCWTTKLVCYQIDQHLAMSATIGDEHSHWNEELQVHLMTRQVKVRYELFAMESDFEIRSHSNMAEISPVARDR